MQKESRLTRVGLTVLICTILLIIAISYLAFQKIRNEACRLVCSVNLKGLGTAMTVYANDYYGNYPLLPGRGPWSKQLGFAYDLEKPDFNGELSNSPRTITACWYLLVRQADVSPKSFVCPQSDQKEFRGENIKNLDVTELWDFGNDSYQHVSYAIHNPFSKYPVTDNLKNNMFAIAADMSPWFDMNGDVVVPSFTVQHN
ncbi:MAG: hypothetical protein OEV87_09000 [Phycisphaerae bacterium]|nr:hypothetical protein [Phycisphaerae bacterium]